MTWAILCFWQIEPKLFCLKRAQKPDGLACRNQAQTQQKVILYTGEIFLRWGQYGVNTYQRLDLPLLLRFVFIFLFFYFFMILFFIKNFFMIHLHPRSTQLDSIFKEYPIPFVSRVLFFVRRRDTIVRRNTVAIFQPFRNGESLIFLGFDICSSAVIGKFKVLLFQAYIVCGKFWPKVLLSILPFVVYICYQFWSSYIFHWSNRATG